MTFLDQKDIEKEYLKKKMLWGSKPNKLVVKIADMLQTGSVLDLGAGEGRNALYLAKRGFKVTGVDISKNAINKLSNFSKIANLNIKILNKDISKLDFNNKFDLILCIATIQFLDRKKISLLIKKMKLSTKDNGINILTGFTNKDRGFKKHPELYFLKSNELKKYYLDFDILQYEEYSIQDNHGKPHQHHMACIVAKKCQGAQ